MLPCRTAAFYVKATAALKDLLLLVFFLFYVPSDLHATFLDYILMLKVYASSV